MHFPLKKLLYKLCMDPLHSRTLRTPGESGDAFYDIFRSQSIPKLIDDGDAQGAGLASFIVVSPQCPESCKASGWTKQVRAPAPNMSRL